MVDREKVIKGLECCQDFLKSYCNGCPYVYEGLCSTNDCTAELASDALVLLKEQEPKPVELHTNAYGTKFYFCPKCGKEFYQNRKQVYCDKCGQAVKWDD